MLKKYQMLISLKYLRSRAVNLIAIVAVMLGVAALIIVTSVMNGFAHNIQDRIRGIMSHIVVEGTTQLGGISDYGLLMDRINTVPGVVACAPRVDCPYILIRVGDRTQVGQLRGIDPVREMETSEIGDYLANVGQHVKENQKELQRVRRMTPEEQKKWQKDASFDQQQVWIEAPLIRYRPDFNYADVLTSRQNDPGEYKELSLEINALGKGVNAVYGIAGSKKAVVEIQFHSDVFGIDEASAWLKEHGYKTDVVEGPRAHENPPNPGTIVGIALAGRFGGLTPGAELSVTSPTTTMDFQTMKFSVVGGFRCGHYEYDSQLMYVPLQTAQGLIGLPNSVTSIGVRIEDPRKLEEMRAAIEEALRNRTPIINLADAADAARIKTVSGNCAVGKSAIPGKDKNEQWLILRPEAGKTAEVIVDGVAERLAQAGKPTSVTLDVQAAEGDFGRSGFRVGLIDVNGNRFYYHNRFQYAAERTPQTYEIANFMSEDGADIIDVTKVKQVVIEARGGPVEVTQIRFEDRRPVVVRTWQDVQRHLLQAVEMERVIQLIIMTLMVVLAGFSIMAILWLMVREKTRDIGILMALGATRLGIVFIFLLNGLMIGIVGSGLGLALGWTISANLNRIEDQLYVWFRWRVFPPDIYYLDRLPHLETPREFILMAVVAMVISLVAALWPAYKASRLDPIEALRYE